MSENENENGYEKQHSLAGFGSRFGFGFEPYW